MALINKNHESICITAILKDEMPFLDEWIIYHRLIGVDHFFLYDDDPSLPLRHFLQPHSKYVTVIPWCFEHSKYDGANKQTKAYWHSVQNYANKFDWIAFIDGDEFIVIRTHNNIKEFLNDFANCSSVALNWHIFGHNGFYEDPEGLVTANLLRRQKTYNRNIKCINRVNAISEIWTPHHCKLKYGRRLDANGRTYIFEDVYDGKSNRAHINHYHCRSFLRWLNRSVRGDACFSLSDEKITEWHWKLQKDKCLEKFVTTVAFNQNEYTDEYMLKYKEVLEREISDLKRH